MGEIRNNPESNPDPEQELQPVPEKLEAEEEKELAPEAIAEQAAKEKLDKITADDFRTFGVRFMNFDELENDLKFGFGGKEVYVFHGKKDDHFIGNFKEYLIGKGGWKRQGHWADTAAGQTDWEESTSNMKINEEFLSALKLAHNEVREKGKNAGLTREKIIEVFQKKMEDILYGCDPSLRWNNLAILGVEHYNEKAKADSHDEDKENGKRKKALEKIYGKERCEVISEFLNNANFFKDDKKNLRKLFDALSTLPIGNEDTLSENIRQYQVAVIFNADDIRGRGSSTHFSHVNWGNIVHGNPGDILAVINTLPNKQMLAKTAKMASERDKNSFPVFRSTGSVAFPKAKK